MQDKLLGIFIKSIDDMITNYSFLYDEEELMFLLNYKLKISTMLGTCPSITDIRTIESDLKRYAYRVWEYELNNGCKLVSWLKDDQYRQKDIVFCNLMGHDNSGSFCNSELGIEYDISLNAIIGASNKDGATLVENKERESFFTIGKIGDKVINSYNRSTPLITPALVLNNKDNTYYTVYNEVLLDGKYISPKSVVYSNDVYCEEAQELASRLDIPCQSLKRKER